MLYVIYEEQGTCRVVCQIDVSNTKDLQTSCGVAGGANPYTNAFALVGKSSALDAIRNGEIAALENPAIEQLKIDLPLHFVEQGYA